MRQIEAVCDTSPEKNIDMHPRLFTDVGSGRGKDELKDLWQWGLVDAQWNEQTEETEWSTSEFADELQERGLQDIYVSACRGDLPEAGESELSMVRYLG